MPKKPATTGPVSPESEPQQQLAVIEPGHNRAKFLGSSDIPALVGRTPPGWRRNSPVALYFDKIAPRVEDAPPPRGVLLRGKRWEGVVGEMLTEEMKRQGFACEVVSVNQRYQDPEVPYFAAEVDMEVRIDDDPELVNVELKTVHPFKSKEWGESGSDQAPDWYVLQCWWAQGVTDRRLTILAPLFGADELRTFIIERDDNVIRELRQRGRQFWENNVLAGVPPDPVTMDDLTLLFPTEKPDSILTATEEVYEKVLELRAAKAQESASALKGEALEYAIKKQMGHHGFLRLEGSDKNLCTWKSSKPAARVDIEGLKAAHPKLVREFTKTAEHGSRIFRVNMTD